MEQIKLQGIVLKVVDYKDSDKLVTIFSLEKGIVTAKLVGVKKAKAKLAFAGQPFCFAEFVLAGKNDFYTVTGATSIDCFFDLTTDIDKYYLALTCLELTSKSLRVGEVSPELFVALIKTLNNICYKEASAMAATIKYFLLTLSIIGYKLSFENCSVCGKEMVAADYFSFVSGGVVCDKCDTMNAFNITKGELAILKIIDKTDVENISNLKFTSNENVKYVLELMYKMFVYKTGEKLNSFKMFV